MIDLPPNAVPFLRQQRTQYEDDSADELQSRFFADVAEFAERLRPFLPPPRPQMRFIDIGCGIGFGMLGLLKIYGPEHDFVGVDRGGSENPGVRYGFSTTPSAYNSLELTREILAAAGVPEHRIECVDIDSDPFPAGPANIVSSTLAWGFHFPVEAYLDAADAALTADGAIIIDVRRGLGQENVLKERFDVVHSWLGQKSDQMILKRKAA
jgi:SAM-dependent methyltransferase